LSSGFFNFFQTFFSARRPVFAKSGRKCAFPRAHGAPASQKNDSEQKTNQAGKMLAPPEFSVLYKRI